MVFDTIYCDAKLLAYLFFCSHCYNKDLSCCCYLHEDNKTISGAIRMILPSVLSNLFVLDHTVAAG